MRVLELVLVGVSVGLIVASACWLFVLARRNPEKTNQQMDRSATVAASRLAGGKRQNGDHAAAPVVDADHPS
jgi:hypothetical protein